MSGLVARVGSKVPRWLTGAVAIDLVLVLLFAYLLYETTQLSGGARRFPLVTIVVTLGLVAIDLLLELFPPLRRRAGFVERDYVATSSDTVVADLESVPDNEPDSEEETAGDRPQGRQPRVFKAWEAMVWLLLLGFGMFLVGYMIMTPVFLAAFFLWARAPLKPAIGITVGVSGFLYLVFYQFLGFT
ncbi:MAG: hypothetical protein GEV10_04075 [Streptosporangiales bacterium]|nr:hypothetical protein [Streptosporangiales bacterium]